MTGPLTNRELVSITQGRPHSNIKYFVETGSYKGDTSMSVSPLYEKVYAIEIEKTLYEDGINSAKSKGIENITFINGDSVSVLPEIITDIKEGAVFFIDAHLSGRDSGWNQKERVPILSELVSILDSKIGPSVFIINDLRLWKSCVWDWAHISNELILNVFTDRGYEFDVFYEENDKFVILTK